MDIKQQLEQLTHEQQRSIQMTLIRVLGNYSASTEMMIESRRKDIENLTQLLEIITLVVNDQNPI